MLERQIPFLSSVLRGDIQNYCNFELQSPDNMTIVNKLLYIDSYYLASMVIFSNVLKQLFSKKLFQNNFSPQIIKVSHFKSFNVGDFKVRDFEVRDFKVRHFKVRDFKERDFRFWTRLYASVPNPKIPHFAIGFLEIPRLQCNPVLEGKIRSGVTKLVKVT